jgi:hypothetical protein
MSSPPLTPSSRPRWRRRLAGSIVGVFALTLGVLALATVAAMSAFAFAA